MTFTIVPLQPVQAQPAAGRDQVVIGLQQEPDFLNPLFMEMAASVSIADTIFVSDIERTIPGSCFPRVSPLSPI